MTTRRTLSAVRPTSTTVDRPPTSPTTEHTATQSIQDTAPNDPGRDRAADVRDAPGQDGSSRTYPMAATAIWKRQGEVAPTRGALALQYDAAEELPTPPRPALRLVPARPALPDAQEWATRLVQAITEAIAGDRPLNQLTRWTDTAVFVDLYRRVRLLGLTTTAGKRAAKERSLIRSVHVSRPAPGVAEVAAHLRTGPRSRAIALRMEAHRGRWICTALELG